MSRTAFLLLLLGLLIGLVLGVGYGWFIDPVKYTNTEPQSLQQVYKDDYVLLIAANYANDGDVAAAQARLATLGFSEPGQAIAATTQRFLQIRRPETDLRLLTLLAIAFRAVTPEMQPYLP